MGRHKKRGRKKKVVKPPRKYVGLKRPYHIITSSNGVQLKDIYSGVDYDSTFKKMKAIHEALESEIEMPVRFIAKKYSTGFTEANYALFMIKKCEDGDKNVNQIRNEYGKYVNTISNKEEWIVLEKMEYQIEEKFWVFGYNPKVDRKTFAFIRENIIMPNSKDKYALKQIAVFKNKLVIDSLNGFNMVICKNHQDSVRLYNEIVKLSEEKKLKYIAFEGDCRKGSHAYDLWFDKIKNNTQWTDRKILKKTTRD